MTFIKEIIVKNIKYLIGLVLFNVIIGICTLVIPIVSKWQIEQLQNKNPSLFGWIYAVPLNLFVMLVLIYSLIKIFQALIQQLTARIRRKLDFLAGIDLEKKLLKKLETSSR